MSYDPERENKSEFMTAWNSASQSLPNDTSGGEYQANFQFTLNTIGEGDCSLLSSILYPAESLYAYFTGDIRCDTQSSSNFGDLFSIGFADSDGDTSTGGNVQRLNRCDDACYSIYDSARLNISTILRSSGVTIAPYVRVLGVMIEE